MSLNRDVFPAPLRPTIPQRSPSPTVNVTSRKTGVAPKATPTPEREMRGNGEGRRPKAEGRRRDYLIAFGSGAAHFFASSAVCQKARCSGTLSGHTRVIDSASYTNPFFTV